MPVNGRMILALLVTFVGGVADLHADPPMVGYVFPAGGQRGTTVTARVGGCNLYTGPKLLWLGDGIQGPSTLNRIDTVWFEGPVIPQPASQQREDYPRDYGARFIIGQNSSLGRHSWRLATSQGVTAASGFIVGDFPEIVEVEEEGDSPTVSVTLPITINGRIFPREDVDAWRFQGTAGQVITCHVATSIFGSPLNARIEISDSQGRVLGESIPAGDVTPPLRLTIPATGEYQVRIHDVGFQGLQNHVYRLTLTAGPFLDAVYPMGGRHGTSTRLQLDGANLAESEVTAVLPATGQTTVFRLASTQAAMGNVTLELDDFDELIELQTSSSDQTTVLFALPCVLNGRIELPGEEDVWRFKAVAGQEYDFDVRAARCGSRLDAVIRLCDSAGKTLDEADDTPGMQTDARLRWTASADGDFEIRIRDRIPSRGGRQFAYRVRATSSVVPEFKLKLSADSVNVERGQSANLKLTVSRGPGFKEPIELTFEGLPAGVTVASPAVVAANQQEVQITLKCDKDTKTATAPVRVDGTATIGQRQFKRFAEISGPAARQGQDSIPVIDPESPLWVSVTMPTPFKFVGVFETKFIPRGGVYIRKYRVERNGFEGPIEVELADRQGRHLQGVTAQPVVVAAGQNEFEFAVNLPPWMEMGRTCRSTLSISGVTTDADGNSHTIGYSSNDQHNQMIALVAAGRLTIQLPQSTVTAQPGKRVELPVRIQRSPGIVGQVVLDLEMHKSIVGVTASPVKIEGNQNAGTLVLEFRDELKEISRSPLTIRATSEDERHLPVIAEAKLQLVDGGNANQGNVRAIRVEPDTVEIRGRNRSQKILATAEWNDGRLIDVTHRVQCESANPEVCRAEGGTAVGVSMGDTELRITCDGITTIVPVHVREFGAYPPVDFTSDLLPLFSKLGCNSGSCHGKASGQNGFKLSVFGFDATADYDALLKEGRGRRVFAANPESSLLLKKATGLAPHGGGQRIKVGSTDYQVLESWILQGTPFEQAGTPTLASLTVSPTDRVMETASQQQILATAHFSDGSKRDVTDASSYATNASQVVDVDRQGLIRTGRVPGEAAITVHYMGHVASVQIQVPRSTPLTPYEFPIQNAVDELVVNKLRKMRIVPSDLADDATFLRRVYIDTIGTLPTSGEVREFLADARPDKRCRWIDRALDRPEYADYWALIWSDILLVDRRKLGERGAYELHRWLREQFAANRPYDQWVSELVTATGNTGTTGSANLFRAVETPEEMARTVSQAFLGVRMECAQCHHHPFEKWSQDDFYGLVGFFNGLERKPIASGRVLVYHSGLRETRIPVTNKLIPTRPLDGQVFGDSASDPRRAFAAWMVGRENPWFARLVANRLWKHFLGRGLVEPEDDMRSTNPATNEPLLKLLAEHVVDAKYDLTHLMRLITNSRTYQLSNQTNPTNQDDEQNFSHHYVGRLPAEVLLDAIGSVTGVPESFPGRPPGTRAIELWDNRLPSYFLEIFGRPERTSPCECGRSSEPTMSQALHLMNAPEVESKISNPNGRVAKLTKLLSEDQALIEELCFTALGRSPREREKSVAATLFASAPRQQAAEDFLWSLLNSYDFLFVK